METKEKNIEIVPCTIREQCLKFHEKILLANFDKKAMKAKKVFDMDKDKYVTL